MPKARHLAKQDLSRGRIFLRVSDQGGKPRLVVERLQIFIAFNSNRDICIQPVVKRLAYAGISENGLNIIIVLPDSTQYEAPIVDMGDGSLVTDYLKRAM